MTSAERKALKNVSSPPKLKGSVLARSIQKTVTRRQRQTRSEDPSAPRLSCSDPAGAPPADVPFIIWRERGRAGSSAARAFSCDLPSAETFLFLRRDRVCDFLLTSFLLHLFWIRARKIVSDCAAYIAVSDKRRGEIGAGRARAIGGA